MLAPWALNTIQPLKSIGGRLPEIARSRLEFPSREKMMGWALTWWRALTRYSTVCMFLSVGENILLGGRGGGGTLLRGGFQGSPSNPVTLHYSFHWYSLLQLSGNLLLGCFFFGKGIFLASSSIAREWLV